MLEIVKRVVLVGEPDEVWALLGDYGSVVRCVPGARLGDLRADRKYDASISVRFGVVPLDFSGSALIEMDPEPRTLTVHAQGRDRARSTRALADVVVSVSPGLVTATTALDVRGTFEFAGPLAWVAEAGGRSVVDRMLQTFADALSRMLAGRPVGQLGSDAAEGSR